jgi:hypothetical protein
MNAALATIDRLDWADIAAQLDVEGYAMLPGLMDEAAARTLARLPQTVGTAHRVPLTSLGLGRGELFYLGPQPPAPLELWRTGFYRHLAVIANRWNEISGVSGRFPAELDAFLRRNRQAGQLQAQSYLSRLGVEDYMVLHQRNEGEHVFPMQIVALLSAPGVDFQGGELVMIEQRPRMQSRPMVLPLKLGDAAIITTAGRPFKGTQGHYRVDLKHAISRVRSGERIGVELTLHDAHSRFSTFSRKTASARRPASA